MKIKLLLLTSIIFTVMTLNSEKSSAEEVFSKKLWTARELHNGLPDFLKDILDKKELIPWGEFSQRNERDNILYASSNIFSPILITYTRDGDFFFNADVLIQEKGESTYTTVKVVMNIKNLNSGKHAEAFFSASTGRLTKLKVREGNQWITLYNLKKLI